MQCRTTQYGNNTMKNLNNDEMFAKFAGFELTAEEAKQVRGGAGVQVTLYYKDGTSDTRTFDSWNHCFNYIDYYNEDSSNPIVGAE